MPERFKTVIGGTVRTFNVSGDFELREDSAAESSGGVLSIELREADGTPELRERNNA